MNLIAQEKYDFFGLQENRMKPEEFRAAANFMDRKEYMLMGTAVTKAAGRAGVAWAVKRKWNPHISMIAGNGGADSMSVWAAGSLWTVLYVIPHLAHQGLELLPVIERLRTEGTDGPWVVVGDLNEGPKGRVPKYLNHI